MNAKDSQQWEEWISSKIKDLSFYSVNPEECMAHFAAGPWLNEQTSQKALNISTLEIESLYAHAYDLYEKEEFIESEKLFRLLVLLDPFIEKYWLGLSAALQMLHKYEEALKGYGVVAALDEESPYSYYYASACLEKLERCEESKHALEKACVLASSSTKYRDLLQSLRKEI